MPHADGTLVINGSVTLRVRAQPGIPEQRLLSVMTGRVVGGKLLMKFRSVPLPDIRQQFEARMRRQRTQR
ncbi:hypothetical protein ASF44_28830 [Pseudorhodoferax sp. Leaf274]|nr:hypothetical protein ASF44_28830 [Pseudorhodoferax sp. Leaf274]